MESDVEASSVRHLFTWNEYFCSQGHQPISRLTLAATYSKFIQTLLMCPLQRLHILVTRQTVQSQYKQGMFADLPNILEDLNGGFRAGAPA